MNILVTGGAGFIGSHLCEKLLNEGNKVCCLDNLCSGYKKNIEHLLDNPNFTFLEADVCDELNENNIDQIYHLACPASPFTYQVDRIKTSKTNFIGTLNMLELAKKNNATFLLTSTSEIYGEPLVSPQIEEYRGNVNTIGPRSCYDEGKRIAETLAMDFSRDGLNVKIVRIFNTYGPRLNPIDGRVVSNFIRQALNNEPITIYGNGNQTRSFCYIDDTVSALIQMMNSVFLGPINIGNIHEITIGDLAETIINMIDSTSHIEYLDLPKDDPTNRCPDISKAKICLNWEPKTNLLMGLIQTINYFKTKL